jgi:hypothetical protein
MEVWKPVKGTHHEVSNLGRIRRVKILKCSLTSHGYVRTAEREGTRYVEKLVHRLVAEVFLGPCPEGKCVNHKNGNKADNRIENLEYVTRKENSNHAASIGLYKTGKKHYKSVLTNKQELKIVELYLEANFSMRE